MPISETMDTGPCLAFVGCAISTAASAGGGGGAGQAQAQGRREVVVSGKRVKTIDVHAHCIVPEAAQLIHHPLEAPGLLWSNVGDRLAQMDHTGVDVEALSINPYWYRAERDAVAEVIRVQNEALVEFCASQPERFVAFATAALQYPNLAAEQVEHAVKTLGFRGVGVAGSVAGEELRPSEIPPVLGEVRRAGSARLPAPARHPRIGAERPVGGEWSPDEHDRQPARNHDRLVASDLRRDTRPLPGPLNLCRAWRRLPAVLCEPLRRGDHDLPGPGRAITEEEADGISQRRTAVFRFDHVHGRGHAAPYRRGGDRARGPRDRLPVPVEHRPRRPHHGDSRA